MKKGPSKKGPSRLARTFRSLGVMIVLGAGLAAYSAVTQRRDVALATGPDSPGQQAFFASASDRPDIVLFYKGLSPAQRITMAGRIGDYLDPKMAGLIGKLLGTFDSEARNALAQSLTKIGHRYPEAVAGQLTQTGSLQQLAISASLRELGPGVLPAVAAELKDAGARPNAVAYLVAIGPSAVPILLPYLQTDDKDIRLAAADALGKIAAKDAVPPLLQLFAKSEGDEKFGYLSALAGIGDPTAEGVLTEVAKDTQATSPRRAQAMLGLGRIASPSSVQTLWSLTDTDDEQLRDAVISGLQLAGPAALAGAHDPDLTLRVAAGVQGPVADRFIASHLASGSLPAARAATGRVGLIPELGKLAQSSGDGAVIDAACRALAATPEGRRRLEELVNDPHAGPFARRRL